MNAHSAFPPTLPGIEVREQQAIASATADYLLARNRLLLEHDLRLRQIARDFADQRASYLNALIDERNRSAAA